MQLTVPVIGILRGVSADLFGEIMAAAFAAGLEAIEVTMNTEGAEGIVSRFRAAVPEGKYLGMGTIRNVIEAERAKNAGAMFMVTPNLDRMVIARANTHGIPIIAGAFTPTEVYQAWDSGADMVKVFPCRTGGPVYIRELRGPFDRIPLVAVGGVTFANVQEYLAAGAVAVGVGASLFGADAMRQRDMEEVGRNLKQFISRCRPIAQDENLIGSKPRNMLQEREEDV